MLSPASSNVPSGPVRSPVGLDTVAPGLAPAAAPLVAPTAEMRRWAERFEPLRRPGSGLGAALVTPIAHVANDSLQFQTYLYVIFHRSVVARVAHMLLMPTIQIAALAVLSGFHPAWAWAAAAALIAWNIRLALRHGVRAVAWVTAPSVVLFAALGQAWAAAGGENGVAPGWVFLAAGLLQAVSHTPEPAVPPRVSGTDRWVPTGKWFREAPVRRVVRAGLMLVAGTLNELWASWRLWPVVVLDTLWRLGFDPQGRATMAALVAEASAQGNPAIDFIGVGGAWGGPYPAADPGPAAEPVAGSPA